MNANSGLLVITIVSFLSMVYVLNSVNNIKKDIANGVIKVRDSYYLCHKLDTTKK